MLTWLPPVPPLAPTGFPAEPPFAMPGVPPLFAVFEVLLSALSLLQLNAATTSVEATKPKP
jgi:hypothetical protein